MSMKKNDWIIASLNNPQTSVGEFRVSGMNLENTQLLPESEYLKSDYIKNNPAFQDSEGNFKQSKFDAFYQDRLQKFSEFSSIDKSFQYDLFDYRRFRDDNAIVKDPELKIGKMQNPQEATISNGWINEYNLSPLSDRELAQKNQVYDSASGKFLDYSPNDHALFQNPMAYFSDMFTKFGEPLVLATYDRDIKDSSGKVIHQKGEKRLNPDGKYYYETLNGRSMAGKTILSGWDVLTIDGVGLNKFDPLDSDDRDKAVGGIIMKNALALAPLFVGGHVAVGYATMLIGREILKSLPMLNGFFAAFTNENTPFSRLANNLAGRGHSMSQSMSDEGGKSFMTLESLANTLTDVALQWEQMKLVQAAIVKLGNTKKLTQSAEVAAKMQYDKEAAQLSTKARTAIEEAKVANNLEKAEQLERELQTIIGTENTWKNSTIGQRALLNAMQDVSPKIEQAYQLGASAGLQYMVMISNSDLYQELLDYGLTKREAIAITLGSLLGMYVVDSKLELGKLFFDKLTSEGELATRATLKARASEWISSITKYAKSEAVQGNKNKLSLLFTKGKELGTKVFDGFWEDLKYHSGGFVSKAIGEGLEEVSEELMTDISKQIYEIAADLPISDTLGGLTTNNVRAFDDFTNNPNAFYDILERYGGNFVGGFLGGATFYGKELVHSGKWHRDVDQDQLIYIIRNSGKDAVMKVLDEYHKKGKLGNKELGVTYQTDSEGKPIFLTNSKNEMSQNDFVYNQLKYEIEGIDRIIGKYDLKTSDGELYDKSLTLGEIRFQKLKDVLMGSDYQDQYIARYQRMLDDLIKVEQAIQNYERPKDSDVIGKEKYKESIEQLEQRKDEILQNLQAFNSGSNAIDYMGRILHEMDPNTYEAWCVPNFQSWLKVIKHISYDTYKNLSQAQQEYLLEEYEKNKTNLMNDAEFAWESFKEFGERLKPDIEDLSMEDEDYVAYQKAMSEILDPDTNPLLEKNLKYVSEDAFSEDSEDDEFRIDFANERLIKADGTEETNEELSIATTQQPGESDEDFKRRKEYRKKESKNC